MHHTFFTEKQIFNSLRTVPHIIVNLFRISYHLQIVHFTLQIGRFTIQVNIIDFYDNGINKIFL